MSAYRDSDGVIVDALELSAPTVINTINGERVGEAGQYLVSLPDGKLVILNADSFAAAFIRVE